MRTALIALVFAAQVSALGFAPEVKSTTKITISAAHLVEPIEITDEAILGLSHVFAGKFIGSVAPTPHPTLTRYTLTFDVQNLDGVKHAAYAVQFCVDDGTGEGFIYLPGLGEPSYRRNVSTILRAGQDGYWHRASDEWSVAIYRYVRR